MKENLRQKVYRLKQELRDVKEEGKPSEIFEIKRQLYNAEEDLWEELTR